MNKVILKLETYDNLIKKVYEWKHEKEILLEETEELRNEYKETLQTCIALRGELTNLLKVLCGNEVKLISGEDIECYHIEYSKNIAKYINEHYKDVFTKLMEEKKNELNK